MPIYTKTGDKGITSLGTGQRVWKDSIRVESYGLIDELNAILGLILSKLSDKDVYFRKLLIFLQNDLFAIGGFLADERNKDLIKGLNDRVQSFEKEIDRMTLKMPVLKNFIFPGGGEKGALLHVARTVARRTERMIISLFKKEKVNSDVIIYINRISDLLLVMARFINCKEGKKELIWSRDKNKI